MTTTRVFVVNENIDPYKSKQNALTQSSSCWVS